MCELGAKNDRLTDQQVEVIKEFPKQVLDAVKTELHNCPENKTNFDWIYNFCIKVCADMNIPLKNLLKQHGFRHAHLGYKPASLVRDSVKKEDEPQVLQSSGAGPNEDFIRLIGIDAFMAYSKRAGLFDKKD